MKTELEIKDIITNKSDQLNTLCRICLSENSYRSTSLFEVRDSTCCSDKVLLCTGIQMHNEDGLPSVICDLCLIELDAADNFRVKCEYSNSLLKKLYLNRNNEVIVNELQQLPSTSEYVKEEVIIDDSWTNFEDSGNNQNETDGSTTDDEILQPSMPARVVKKEKSKVLSTENFQEYPKQPETEINSNAEEVNKNNLIDNKFQNTSIQESQIVVDDLKVKSKKLSCDLCSKLLSTKYSLEKHMASMHRDVPKRLNVKMYHCTECSYSTPRSYTLSYHMSVHTGEKPYKCDTCDRCFAQPSSLYVHKKSHSDKMYYTCAECGKQFKHKFIYENHKNVHNDIKKYPCTICNKGLRSQQTLEDHMNRHYNIKNFSCEICGSTFVTRVELISHGKKHSDEKRFQCGICEYRCNVKKSLETHILRHTGERLFKCELCELSCYTRVELKLHMRKHTKEKNYSCPVCQIKFSRSTGVNKHMLYTHGIQYKINDTTDRRIIK